MRTTIRAPARFQGTRVRLLLGASSCSAKSKASVVVPNGQHRGPVRRFRPRVAGTLVQERGRGEHTGRAAGPGARPNWRPANLAAFWTHVYVSPDCNATIPPGCTCGNVPPGRGDGKPADVMAPRNASGAPGRGAAAKPRQAWLPSVHLLCQPGRPLPVLPGLTRLPRLVARGYLAAVPGRVNVRSTFLRRNHRPAKP